MPELSFQEKRSYSRFPISIPVTYFQNRMVYALTEDISAGGLSFVCEEDIPSGSDIKLYLHLSDKGDKIHRQGKVVWSKFFDFGKYKIGIKIEGQKLQAIPLVLRAISLRYKT